MYHGTSKSFSRFASESEKSQSTYQNDGWYGAGSYFTDNPEYASSVAESSSLLGRAYGDAEGNRGQQVYKAYLSIKNPFIFYDDRKTDRKNLLELNGWSEDERNLIKSQYGTGFRFGDAIPGKRLTEVLESNGYDGSVLKYGSGFDEAVAFHPNQIKSVWNKGTFDPSNDDISFSLSDFPSSIPETVYRGGSPGTASVSKASDSNQFGAGVYFGALGVAERWAKNRPNGIVETYRFQPKNPYVEAEADPNLPKHKSLIDSIASKFGFSDLSKRHLIENYGGLGTLQYIRRMISVRVGSGAAFGGAEELNSLIKEAGYDE